MRMVNAVLLLTIFACGMATAGCADSARMEGMYQSGADARVDVLLELKPDGRGSWQTSMDTVTFRWKVRGREIWFHTQTGGVMVGDVLDSTHLKMDLPGVGVITFERAT